MKEEEDWIGGSDTGFISLAAGCQLVIPDPGPAANHWTMQPAHPSTCQDRWLTTGQRKLALLGLVRDQCLKGLTNANRFYKLAEHDGGLILVAG